MGSLNTDCSSPCRWCEQFAIGGGVTEYAHASESAEFDRAPFYDLEVRWVEDLLLA